jgi:hypothetical protein
MKLGIQKCDDGRSVDLEKSGFTWGSELVYMISVATEKRLNSGETLHNF